MMIKEFSIWKCEGNNWTYICWDPHFYSDDIFNGTFGKTDDFYLISYILEVIKQINRIIKIYGISMYIGIFQNNL